ncbi:MAG: hypothetical protein ABI627_31980 [Polyangiaceae bacterium]
MLRRILLGLFEGLVIGLTLGAGAARGLGLIAPGGVTAWLLGAAAGLLVGLVAGRPVWSRDGKTEALLKAGAGALGGAGLAFAAGHWLKAPLDLSALQLGVGAYGKLTAAVLPLVATALALFFELDDDDAGRAPAPAATGTKKQRLPAAAGSANTSKPDELEFDEAADTEHRRGKR